jgi:hypothetical protein
MKKYIFTALLMAIAFSSCVQEQQKEETTISEEPKQESITVPTFKLYPTSNRWNFLKLNTATGVITIVQYSIDEEDKTFEYSLNEKSLIPIGDHPSPGRFELTPTQNIWNFILLDQVSGATYQVQWSFEEKNRFVIPIK